jgi:hypothetical protein
MLDSIVNGLDLGAGKEKKLVKKITKPKKISKAKKAEVKEAVIPNDAKPVETNIPNTIEPTSKTDLFNSLLSNKAVKQMDLSADEKKCVSEAIEQNITDTMTCVVRTCNSEKCKQKGICPFSKIEKFPDGSPCPLEVAIADFMSVEYFKMITEETETTNYNIVEISTVNSLIEVELEEFRARVYSNTEGQIISQAAFVIKDTDEVIYNDIENPIYNLREKLDRRKQKLLQRLLITPEAKARFKIEDKGRGAKSTTDLISSAEKKIQKLKIGNNNGTKGS